jgi:pantoate--beta-alanine ligase
VFGKKDFQQLLIIRLMAVDLGLALDIVGVDTVREPDGLAVSSRNRYLLAEERTRAPQLHAALERVTQAVAQGPPVAKAEEVALAELRTSGFRPDYISVRRPSDLGEPGASDKSLVVLAAAWLGRTRLIDNLEFELGTV